VRERVGRAAAFARSGQGPVLLEAVTYRYRGHSMSDPAKYRPEGELDEKKKSDPLLICEAKLKTLKVPDADVEKVKADVEAIVQDAWDFADSSPEPDPSTLYDYVYAPPRAEAAPVAK
jgi:pyruvate dehydrogenase E1 component alpha subunit